MIDILGLVIAALGGTAVGVERQWSGHADGADARFAGVRTFTLLGGLGGLAGWLWQAGYTLPATVLLAGARRSPAPRTWRACGTMLTARPRSPRLSSSRRAWWRARRPSVGLWGHRRHDLAARREVASPRPGRTPRRHHPARSGALRRDGAGRVTSPAGRAVRPDGRDSPARVMGASSCSSPA
jgi:hypothetical protein